MVGERPDQLAFMDLRDLRYFVATAKAGSLTRAAREVNISQPALSYQLKQLELELGVSLFVRQARGVTPTEAGAVLLEKATALLADFAEIGPALSAFRAPKLDSLIFGLSPTAAKVLASDLIGLARSMNLKGVSISEGLSDDLVQLVSDRRIDCAVCYDAGQSMPGLISVPLLSEDLFAVAKPPTFGPKKGSTITFDQLARLPLVLDSTHHAGRRLVDKVAKQVGRELDIVSVTSVTVKRELISRNGLCTVVPFGLYAEETASGSLEARRIIEPNIRRTLSLIYNQERKASFAPLVRRVTTLVQRKIAEGNSEWRPPEGSG